MKVKPAPGRTVRDPHSKMVLPPEGRDVPDHDPFWQRRIRDGDVIVDKPTQSAAPHASASDPHTRYATKKEA